MEARLNHLTYAICNIATDLSNIDFSQVGQSSAGTIYSFCNKIQRYTYVYI